MVTNQWDVSEFVLGIISAGNSMDLEFFFVTAWAIWFNKNQIVFDSTCQHPQQIWNFAMGYLRDFKANWRNQHKQRTVASSKGKLLLVEFIKSMSMGLLLRREETLGSEWSLEIPREGDSSLVEVPRRFVLSGGSGDLGH